MKHAWLSTCVQTAQNFIWMLFENAREQTP